MVLDAFQREVSPRDMEEIPMERLKYEYSAEIGIQRPEGGHLEGPEAPMVVHRGILTKTLNYIERHVFKVYR